MIFFKKWKVINHPINSDYFIAWEFHFFILSFLFQICFFLASLLPSLDVSLMKFKKISCFYKHHIFLTNFPVSLCISQRLTLPLPLSCSVCYPSTKRHVPSMGKKTQKPEMQENSCRLLSLIPLDFCPFLNERDLSVCQY